PPMVQVAEQRGMNVGELLTHVEQPERLAKLVGRFVVLAVILGPELVGVRRPGWPARARGHRAGTDGNQGRANAASRSSRADHGARGGVIPRPLRLHNRPIGSRRTRRGTGRCLTSLVPRGGTSF